MNDILKTLDRVLKKKSSISHIDRIRTIYSDNNFTDKQKQAAEVFLFDPTVENAIEALKRTPKVMVFLVNYFDGDTLAQELRKVLEDEKISRTYLKTLFTHNQLNPIVSTILKVTDLMEIRKVKAYTMEMSLNGKPYKADD